MAWGRERGLRRFVGWVEGGSGGGGGGGGGIEWLVGWDGLEFGC